MKGAVVSGKTGAASTRPKGARAASHLTGDDRGFRGVFDGLRLLERVSSGTDHQFYPERFERSVVDNGDLLDGPLAEDLDAVLADDDHLFDADALATRGLLGLDGHRHPLLDFDRVVG